MSLFRVLRPNAGNIADTLYINRPHRGIRSDALFNLLSLSNIHYYTKALIKDDTGGVVLGSVLERTSCPLTCIYKEKFKDHALKYFGYQKKGNSRIQYSLIEDVTEEYDSLLIVSKDNFLETLMQCFPKLKGSGAFAGYYQDILEISNAYEWLLSSGSASNILLEEIWSRDYQVLPERTHPDVKTRIGTSGGYLLSGIKHIV